MEALYGLVAGQSECSYALEIVQQPVRARMCGLGDKDRRPISPPLIVKLIARDIETNEEIPLDEADTTFLIMAADLRSSDTSVDANLIFPPTSGQINLRSAHSRTPTPPANTSDFRSQDSPKRGGSPCDSLPPPSSIATFSTLPPAPTGPATAQDTMPSRSLTGNDEEEDRKPVVSPTLSAGPSPKRPSSPPIRESSCSGDEKPSARKRVRTSGGSCDNDQAASRAHPSSTFIPYAESRSALSSALPETEPADTTAIPNLIGTLHTNAYKLKDTADERGIFFVLPDLSVRTEGTFRLRLRLLNVGLGGSQANTVSAVVATEVTDEFRVFSAKKFEGMLDPTPLSQCFAKQGVRIPTRKVAKSRTQSAGKAVSNSATAS
ncbi:hypothetical protein JCM11641_007955 [Rhodosporidiobolus odoratus]